MIFLPLKINLFRIVVSTLMFVVSGVYSNEIGDSLASINFRISDMKVMAHNYSDFSGEIKSLSCEAIFSFNDSSVDVFTLVIDSIVENNNELIGSCCNSH